MKRSINTKSVIVLLLLFSLILIISGCQAPLRKPNAPSELSAEAISSTEVKLTWKDNSNNEDGFKIERKTEDGIYTVIATLPKNTTEYIDTEVEPGITYYYRVFAFNSAGNSDYSNEVKVTTPLNIPSSPKDLQAIVVYPNKIQLTWKDSSNNEDGFKIYSKTPSGNWTLVATVESNTESYIDEPAVLTLLEYKVTAYNESGESGGSTATSQGYNLISTFETGIENWIPRGQGVNISQSSEKSNTGQYSLKTIGRTQNWHGASILLYDESQGINLITPGKKYYISLWIYQSTGSSELITLTVERKRKDGGTTWDTVAWQKPVSQNTWTKITGIYEFPTDASRALFYIESPNSTLEFFVDDVAIVEEKLQ